MPVLSGSFRVDWEITQIELAPSPFFFTSNAHSVDINVFTKFDETPPLPVQVIKEPEDHWSFIAHLIAKDMLKSAVTEEKKFKNIECE